ncbi:D-hexose-6-phosphate mutarotase [Thalassotalea piscium]|uniref:Putative glucose-6-phosphate 1-epimerase n=1 Tax=Thalassotalea piscium TaxID=1230533 RepID=A0A7X0NDU4_9GAMM|nr:D-hexose-6-phosphate mutarotase [Thalassotalea piscium]MBB6541602.1 glucose-6-phosphate 1-epimerase [Thalassotalea piscium]
MSYITLLTNDFGKISQYQKANGIDILEIKHRLCAASISLYGGQVLNWQPVDQLPVFWLSDRSIYQPGKAIRGGIPICWPWFGAYKDAGNHGFARQIQWHLDDIKLTENEVVLVFSTAGENVSPFWPHAFKLVQKISFSTDFTQQLTIENLSVQSVKFTSALHSYFNVSSPKNTSIQALNNVLFDDKVSLLNDQKDTLTNCVGPLDRIYHNQSVQQIKDIGWQRTIEVKSTQCEQWVLWNPGRKIAESMTDIHKEGENEFVCLEAANTKWLTIAGHESITLEQTVSVSANSNVTPR